MIFNGTNKLHIECNHLDLGEYCTWNPLLALEIVFDHIHYRHHVQIASKTYKSLIHVRAVDFCIKNDKLDIITMMMNANSFQIKTANLICAIFLQPELRSFF